MATVWMTVWAAVDAFKLARRVAWVEMLGDAGRGVLDTARFASTGGEPMVTASVIEASKRAPDVAKDTVGAMLLGALACGNASALAVVFDPGSARTRVLLAAQALEVVPYGEDAPVVATMGSKPTTSAEALEERHDIGSTEHTRERFCGPFCPCDECLAADIARGRATSGASGWERRMAHLAHVLNVTRAESKALRQGVEIALRGDLPF